MTCHNILLKSALEQAELIRSKEISARELLELHVRQYKKHHDKINAVIFTRLEEARATADQLDEELRKGTPRGPLHGVTMTVKDSYDLLGTPSTWGIPELRANFPDTDSLAVTRLKEAGLVIYGKTNVPYRIADWQSFNAIYGTTNNPWNLERTPGGSSGGAAAALATSMSSLEIGSDIGASIRNPAHYCGLFGHNPSYGIVPLHGHQPPGHSAFLDLLVGGPLARSTPDLKAALDILSGAAGHEEKAWTLRLPAARKTTLGEFRVAAMLESPVCAQDDPLTQQLHSALDRLRAAGANISEVARPNLDFEHYHHVYLLLLRAATGTILSESEFQDHLEGARLRSVSDHSYRAHIDRGVSLHYKQWWHLHNEREKFRIEWKRFFSDYDILLCPVAASTAFPHDHSGERADRTIPINGKPEAVVDQLFWAGITTLARLPSSVIPVGTAADNLPCGLQIITDYLEDHTALEFAGLAEQILGGFIPPNGFH